MLPIFWILGGGAALFLATRKSTPAAAPGGVTPGAGGGGAPPAGGAGCSDPGVVKLPPPAPGFGTGFAALPTTPVTEFMGKSYKDVIEAFMKMTPASHELAGGEMLRPALIAAAATSAENWAKSLRCSGYNDAANLMAQQALEMRQWK